MDLNTTTNWSTPVSNGTTFSRAGHTPKRAASSRNTSSGAVRRGSQHAPTKSQHKLLKLSALAMLVAGSIAWAMSSDLAETIEVANQDPTNSATGVQQTKVAEIALVPTAPAFFFDDNADALKQFHNDANASAKTDEASTTLSNSEVTKKASDALLAMAATPSALNPSENTASVRNPEHGEAQFKPGNTPLSNKLELAKPDALPIAKTTTPLGPETLAISVSSGDTLSGILNSNGLDSDELNQLLSNELVKQHLSSININQLIEIEKSAQGQFTALTTKPDNDTRINIERTGLGFDVAVVDLPLERQRHIVSGEIEQSLYLTAEQANLKQSTIMELSNIFQWELDFARDIRKGDRFSLVYDKLFREGEYIGDGDILAAEFVRGGKSHRAIYLSKEDGSSGYYSPEGDSKRRTFLRHPVDVVRITSKFDPNRMHPVLHQIRAHRGVDYGSPHGSPIYATADGTVIHAGPKSAYGNTVVLKHAQQFSTLYAHMSRISSKSKVGTKVKQGDVIGFVGKTGRVTGTHLHYEFRINGEQIDPLKVDLPKAAPLEDKYRTRLADLSERYTKMMAESLRNLQLQATQPTSNSSFLKVRGDSDL